MKLNVYGRILTLGYLIVLSGMDIVTTHLALVNGAREGNPFAAHILDTWGEPFLYLFKLGAIAAVCILGMWRGLWLTLWAMNALMVVVVLSNLTHV